MNRTLKTGAVLGASSAAFFAFKYAAEGVTDSGSSPVLSQSISVSSIAEGIVSGAKPRAGIEELTTDLTQKLSPHEKDDSTIIWVLSGSEAALVLGIASLFANDRSRRWLDEKSSTR